MNAQQLLKTLILVSSLSSCKSKTVPRLSNNVGIEKHEVVGHYQFITTGYHLNCESVKHEIDLDTSQGHGSFLYHVFCLPFSGDSTGVSSLVKPYSMIGNWSYTSDSSIIKLVAVNGQILNLKIERGRLIGAFDENNHDLMGEIFFKPSKK